MLNALCDLTRFGMCEMRTAPKNYGQGLTTQLLRIMKLSAIFLLAACLTVSAKGITQKVTLRLKDAHLEKVFAEIKKQTGYSIFYNYRLVEKAKPVTVDLNNVPIEEAMRACLMGQPLDFEIADRSIVIKERPAQTIIEEEATPPVFEPITGVVTDTSGKPLAGATISIKGTKKAVTTDQDGRFVLDVKPGDILVISYVGFKEREIKVDNEKVLRIFMTQRIVEGGEIVINTGYEKISKERFVGSYQQMDSAAFHSRPGMGIIERLDGRVNSVFFQKKGNSQLPKIMVRGLSTIPVLPGNVSGLATGTSAAPLIVVDNFPMPENFRIENINPNDVESITVLTDAVAASIWGARSGNGVIVVTTKRGKYNQRFQVNVSSNITLENKPDLYYYDQVTPSQYIDMEQYLFSKGGYNAVLSNTINQPPVTPVVEILDRHRRGLMTKDQAQSQIDALRNYDLRQELDKNVYQNALRQQHYLSVNGGTNILNYQLSGGYTRSLNNIQGSKPDDQYTLTTNTSFKPYKNLEIITGINVALSKTQSTVLPSMPSYPYARLADDEGHALAIPLNIRLGYVDTVGGGNLLDWHYRPLDEIRFADRTSSSRFIRLNAAVNYRLTSWMQASVQYQYQSTFGHIRNYASLRTYSTRSLINLFTNLSQNNPNQKYPVPMGGILSLSDNLIKDYNVRGSLIFNKSFRANHLLTGLVGWELSDSKGGYISSSTVYGYDDVTGTSRGTMDFLTNYPTFYPSASSSKISNGAGYLEGATTRFVSVIANAGYTYKSRYSLFASARRDGANLFGVSTNNKWKPLWSVGAGWELSKEAFYHLAWLPYLKLRSSYGYTGNVNNSVLGLQTIFYTGLVSPVTGFPYADPGVAPNSNLRWEETRVTNMGVDFQAFRGKRLSGSFEIYSKMSNDVITAAPMPASSGMTSFVKNYASLKTSGYEINLASRNIEGLISWTSAAGWSHAKTTVKKLFTSLGHSVEDYLEYNLNAFPGQVIFGLTSYRWAGLDPLTGDPLGYYQGHVSKNYTGIFQDSIQNQVFHGSSLPLSSAFFRNTISWKGLSLSFNITGRFQYYFREPAININSVVNLSSDYFRRWQQPGDEAFTNIPSIYYPIPGAVSNRSVFYQYAAINVKRADNIRLQDVNLSYQWNNKGKKTIPFQNATIFLYPNNLNWILWRLEDSDWDPDFAGGNNPGIAPPTPKTWTAGINLSF